MQQQEVACTWTKTAKLIIVFRQNILCIMQKEREMKLVIFWKLVSTDLLIKIRPNLIPYSKTILMIAV